MARQMRIVGTEGEKLPDDLQKAGEKYADLLAERQETQTKENQARIELIAKMKEHKVSEYVDHDHAPPVKITLVKVDAKHKVTVKKLDDGDDGDDDE